MGRELLAGDAKDSAGFFSKSNWHGQLMDWAMRMPVFKNQLFRFIDVLPSLHNSEQVLQHLREYLQANNTAMPTSVKLGIGMAQLAPNLAASTIRRHVGELASLFITGASPIEAILKLKSLRERNVAFTADLLGELIVSEQEADAYQSRCVELLEVLTKESKSWPNNPQLDQDEHGPLPRVNVSVKMSALTPNLDPIDSSLAIEILSQRLRPLLRRARELGTFINFDMESRYYKDLTLTLFRNLLNEPDFRDWPHVGFALQAYLRDSESDLRTMLDWAKQRGTRATVRLVKGAYWDYETIMARQRGWPVPVFSQKAETDANFEKLSAVLLENSQHLRAAFASHNARSLANCIVRASELGVNPRDYEIQMLYGMAESIRRALVGMGLRVRDYTPIGELLPGMAYLVRRLLENTSNEGFIRARFSEQADPAQLLLDPATRIRPKSPTPLTGFQNAPTTDFGLSKNQGQMRTALAKVRGQFGRAIPLRMGKELIATAQSIDSTNPDQPDEIIARVECASVSDAEKAVALVRNGFSAWRRTPVEKRAEILDRTANLMDERRFDLAALEVFEVGKPWREADADVVEAIDFCRYYASEMRRLGPSRVTQKVAGEQNQLSYQPRGVGVVIAPWNFPLAILTGMTTAALVTGNVVIMKPSLESPVIAAEFAGLLFEAGLPTDALAFLPGPGNEIGEYLVNHPDVQFVAFTGSKEVGLRIWEAAGRTSENQRHLKHAIAEMGGKNALIVDESADLDEAVPAILQSAFGYAGQKCSALSRLIVLDGIYDKLLDRLLSAAATMRVGPPEEPATQIGPVISAKARKRILDYIELGRTEAKLAFEGKIPSQGHFVPPTIFTEVEPNSRIAREEIFGPVLAVLRARDFGDALRLANDSEFELTGGVFSRTPSHLKLAQEEFEVGNLYLNRTITGAIVERQPFGGFRMSGGGTKAGGADYLLHFLQPKVITENTLRRGFAPED